MIVSSIIELSVLSQRATARCFGIHKIWESKFASEKAPLMLYGDELYTTIGNRVDACDSQGWTAVIMDRANRFIVEQHCGRKDEKIVVHY